MSSRRVLKVAEAIREVVGMAILTDLNDPRIQDVTVTSVEVAPDLRSAKVNVSVMGDTTKQELSLRGLQNAAGYLQSKLKNRIDTRYTPRLQFVLDQGVKRSIAMAKLLREVLPPDHPAAAELDLADHGSLAADELPPPAPTPDEEPSEPAS
ncbi:MAG: 30S ribosome-binding factor RbfA [Pirellulales bacterium]|nr:30S ribosome-binding factor RbfA [Pirellulales bacterium]